MNLIADPTLSVLQSWKNEDPTRRITVVRGTRWFVQFDANGLPAMLVSGETLALALMVAARAMTVVFKEAGHVHVHSE